MTQLAGVFAKIDGAEEHIGRLHKAIQRWGAEEPYSLTEHDNAEKTERSFHIKINQPPDLLRWGVEFGEAVFDLRSALDHIAWQAAGGDVLAPPWTEFPVFKDEPLYKSTDRGGGLNKITGVVDAEYRALFERCQPWNNPDGHDKDPLWMLHSFNLVDKHRLLTPILVMPLRATGKVLVTYADKEAAEKADALPPPSFISQPQADVHDGAEVFRVATRLPFVDMQVQQTLHLGVSLLYGTNDAHSGGLTFLLAKLVESTRGIAEQFRDAGL